MCSKNARVLHGVTLLSLRRILTRDVRNNNCLYDTASHDCCYCYYLLLRFTRKPSTTYTKNNTIVIYWSGLRTAAGTSTRVHRRIRTEPINSHDDSRDGSPWHHMWIRSPNAQVNITCNIIIFQPNDIIHAWIAPFRSWLSCWKPQGRTDNVWRFSWSGRRGNDQRKLRTLRLYEQKNKIIRFIIHTSRGIRVTMKNLKIVCTRPNSNEF